MIRKYHPGKAIVSGVLTAIPFILLPILFLRAFQTLLPEMITLELQMDMQTLEGYIISIGAGVVAMAFLTAFYTKGLAGRVLFGCARQGAKFAWVYFFFNAGFITLLVTIEQEGGGSIPLEAVSFAIQFTQLLYILYFAILLMVMYFVAEYLVYRRVLQEQYYVEPSFY